MHHDNNGRYVMISGCLQNEKLTLVNLYAPNTQQSLFFAFLCPVISQFMEGLLIMGGDFNSVCDPTLNRSSSPLSSDKQTSAALKEFQTQLAVTDVWRLINPTAREYSFYSGVHNSYSRIDYIMLSSNLVQNVVDINYYCLKRSCPSLCHILSYC